MTSCPEAMGWDSWVFWKKQLVEIWDWTKRVGIRIWARPVQLFAAGCARVGWVSELRADAGPTVSIVKIVFLSPRVENLKVKTVIKVSYLNYRESSVFRVFFRIPMHVNVLQIRIFAYSVYPYHGYATHTLNVKQFYLTHRYDPIRCYHFGPELAREWWQWRGTQHSLWLQYLWNFTIRLFSVISGHLLGKSSPLQRCSWCILQPQPVI